MAGVPGARGHLGSRNVRRAVFFDLHVRREMRHLDISQRNFPAPERFDVNVELQYGRRETAEDVPAGSRPCKVSPSKRARKQPPAKMKISQLDARAGGLLQLLHDRAARPAIREPAGNHIGDGQPDDQRQRDDERPARVSVRIFASCPFIVADSERRLTAWRRPVSISIFNRDFVSSSHFAVRSLIPRWMSNSRICSSTSARPAQADFFSQAPAAIPFGNTRQCPRVRSARTAGICNRDIARHKSGGISNCRTWSAESPSSFRRDA